MRHFLRSLFYNPKDGSISSSRITMIVGLLSGSFVLAIVLAIVVHAYITYGPKALADVSQLAWLTGAASGSMVGTCVPYVTQAISSRSKANIPFEDEEEEDPGVSVHIPDEELTP